MEGCPESPGPRRHADPGPRDPGELGTVRVGPGDDGLVLGGNAESLAERVAQPGGVTPQRGHIGSGEQADRLLGTDEGLPGRRLEPLELPTGTGVHNVLPASDRSVRAVHLRGAEAVPTLGAVLRSLVELTAGRRPQPSQRSSASRQV